MFKIDTTNLPATKLKYHEDGYARSVKSWVDAVGSDDKGRAVLVLSETVFYAQGGGQRGDRGKIFMPASLSAEADLPHELMVVDTRKENGFVVHVIENSAPVGVLQERLVGTEEVQAEIDWDFRFKQMRLHSSAHLIHCFMETALGRSLDPPKLSDLQEDRGVNRYEVPNLLTESDLSQAVQRMNQFTAGDHRIRTAPDTTPGRPAWARLWHCETWTIPCGGVHPKNTSEIGPLRADLSVKKGQTTVTFSLV